ncbi:MAG: hypothetical protein F6J90_33545 [Moorea sp. SIOASIH]|uniref:hypothetical protein n=1 Tax=Moorena sp. SIOASIH TaxID=2607817 RepID=UPI0013B9FE43|nr:hypothetical protein [Moorena sp. SIOASIH]NEO40994.1 hypothetical protein [Moorena sp. SIOASIH]
MFSSLIRYTRFFHSCLLPLPCSRFPIPDSRFPTPDSRLPIPCSLFPVPCSLKPKIYTSSN